MVRMHNLAFLMVNAYSLSASIATTSGMMGRAELAFQEPAGRGRQQTLHKRITFCSIPVTGMTDGNSAKVAPARKNFPNHPTQSTHPTPPGRNVDRPFTCPQDCQQPFRLSQILAPVVDEMEWQYSRQRHTKKRSLQTPKRTQLAFPK